MSTWFGGSVCSAMARRMNDSTMMMRVKLVSVTTSAGARVRTVRSRTIRSAVPTPAPSSSPTLSLTDGRPNGLEFVAGGATVSPSPFSGSPAGVASSSPLPAGASGAGASCALAGSAMASDAPISTSRRIAALMSGPPSPLAAPGRTRRPRPTPAGPAPSGCPPRRYPERASGPRRARSTRPRRPPRGRRERSFMPGSPVAPASPASRPLPKRRTNQIAAPAADQQDGERADQLAEGHGGAVAPERVPADGLARARVLLGRGVVTGLGGRRLRRGTPGGGGSTGPTLRRPGDGGGPQQHPDEQDDPESSPDSRSRGDGWRHRTSGRRRERRLGPGGGARPVPRPISAEETSACSSSGARGENDEQSVGDGGLPDSSTPVEIPDDR
jgi:hypothetical protein